MTRNSPPFLDIVRDAIGVRHYSIRTEQACLTWIRRFIPHHGKQHPREMGAPEVGSFLTHLAVDRNFSAGELVGVHVLPFFFLALAAGPRSARLAREENPASRKSG